jgi:hypothetical protein
MSVSNFRRLIVVNVLLLVPTLVFLYTAVRLVPLVIQYIDSLNISVVQVNPEYGKLAFVVLSRKIGQNVLDKDKIFVFKKQDFNSIRKHIFLSSLDRRSLDVLQEKSISHGEITYNSQPVLLQGKNGYPVATLQVENVREGTIEIMFYNSELSIDHWQVMLYSILMAVSFLIVTGSQVGISDYTQRVVFHEARGLTYLFKSIRGSFLQSITISLLYCIVFGAVIANIYFYMFVMTTDFSVFIAAVNFWMIIFFFFILLWVYPLFVLNRGESILKVMKKSLYLSFDNFQFTLDSLLFVFGVRRTFFFFKYGIKGHFFSISK